MPFLISVQLLFFIQVLGSPLVGYVTLNNYTSSDCSSAPTIVHYPLGGCSTSTQSSYGASFLAQCTATISVIPVNDYALVQR